MFQFLQTSLFQALQQKFQLATAALDLVRDRQVALETLIGAVHNDLTHSMSSVHENFGKYLKEHGTQDKLSTDPDVMQIDFIGAVPN